jgi:hypothetical protein
VRSLPAPVARAIALICLVAVAATGCNNDSLAPFQPEVTNQPDTFQLQATAVKNVTTTLEYDWQNSGTTANVNQATVMTDGAASLTILDADGTQMYARDLAENGTFVTGAGTAGLWTIRMVLTSFDGTLNFRVEKP